MLKFEHVASQFIYALPVDCGPTTLQDLKLQGITTCKVFFWREDTVGSVVSHKAKVLGYEIQSPRTELFQ